MDYIKKKKELEEKFEAIKKEVGILEQVRAQKLEELMRLQGEFRLLQELSTPKVKN